MDLISAPPTVDEVVTDLSLAFAAGAFKDFTLRTGDVYHETDKELMIVFADGEVLTVRKRHLAWKSSRTRVIKTPVKTVDVIPKAATEQKAWELRDSA